MDGRGIKETIYNPYIQNPVSTYAQDRINQAELNKNNPNFDKIVYLNKGGSVAEYREALDAFTHEHASDDCQLQGQCYDEALIPAV